MVHVIEKILILPERYKSLEMSDQGLFNGKTLTEAINTKDLKLTSNMVWVNETILIILT